MSLQAFPGSTRVGIQPDRDSQTETARQPRASPNESPSHPVTPAMSARPPPPPPLSASSSSAPADQHHSHPHQPQTPTAAMDTTTPSPTAAPLLGFQVWVSQAVVASFIAGGVAGAVSRTVVSPLERLKILLQVQTGSRTEYKMSISKALGKIWREEGFKGMMAGNGTNCIRIVPYSAVQFGSYNFYKRFFEASPGEPLSPARRLLCGATAGITSVTFTYPLDIVRTRLSIQSASFSGLSSSSSTSTNPTSPRRLPGMWATLRHMYATEGGLPALYRGIIPTVAGVAPYVGLNFMIYESVRHSFTPPDQTQPSPLGKLCAGAISGGVAQTCTYPLDVLRRRFQINTMSGMGYQYKGIFDAVKVIVGQEGVRGLYKGIAPNLLKVAPSMASSWLSFEMTRDFLVGLRPEEELR
ncbi:hypothetical protein D0863_09518 [Hortaea werneckii]|uniref:Mitochondrial thiamine pyrophosphate carrier 1 n=3 Tax=Hortaea werneckii TaxID=91943 RepID=A0A3M7DLB2_HORWE|nr:hypothetical protein D0863_09518 [Hortaea werneckii]